MKNLSEVFRFYIKGQLTFIRTLHDYEVEKKLIDWLNDPVVNTFLEVKSKKYDLIKQQNFVKKINKNPNSAYLGIFSHEQVLIGTSILRIENLVEGTVSVGIMVGDKSCWGKGFGSDALLLVCSQLKTNNFKTIFAGVDARNLRSKRLFQRCGFEVVKSAESTETLNFFKNLRNK